MRHRFPTTPPAVFALSVILATNNVCRAAFLPVPLTPESFNYDVVVEKTAPPPVVSVTTASMERGTENTGFSFYERGYNTDWASTGLPPAGSTVTSETASDHDFRFAPDYKSSNAVLLDPTIPDATLSLGTPTSFVGLSVLASAANGRLKSDIGYTVHYEDGSSETGTLTCPDWVTLGFASYAARAMIDVAAFTFSYPTGDEPHLYALDIPLSQTGIRVKGIDLHYLSTSGHAAIFALSGSSAPAEPFLPLTFTGYNHDLVVEASATKPAAMFGVTTATAETGTANSQNTWFEQGYLPSLPQCGLPPAGSTLTHTATGYPYLLPPDYAASNAALQEPGLDPASLIPATAFTSSRLSFLTASSHGPVTNLCVISHADGSSETNSFISPDWLDSTTPAAFTANGRLNINKRMVNSLNAGLPSLFAVDLPLTNTVSPVTNILLRWQNGSPDSRSFVFALSASTETDVTPPTLTLIVQSDGTLTLATTSPGTLQSTTALDGPNTVWHDEGHVESTISLPRNAEAPAMFFRLLKQ